MLHVCFRLLFNFSLSLPHAHVRKFWKDRWMPAAHFHRGLRRWVVSYMTFKPFSFFFFTSVFDSDTSQCQRMFSLVILAFHYSSKSLLCYVTVCLPCDRPLCLAQNTYLSLWSSDLLYTSLQRNSNKNLTKTEDKKSHFLVPDYRMTWLHSYGSVDPDYRKICCGLETGEAE